MKFQRKALAVLALILISAGCEQAKRVDDITAPAYAANKAVVGFVKRSVAVDAETACVERVTPGQNAILRVGPNTLEIPRKASFGQTTYCMTIKAGSTIGVELTAWHGTEEAHNFLQPLRLTLSYADANANYNFLKVVYVVNGQVVEVLGTAQDHVNRTVTANLKHFSDYVVGFGPQE